MPKSSTDEMLGTFKEQLESDSKQLAIDHNLTKRGDYLIWWYFVKIRGYDPEEVPSFICDGGNDLGIDAIEIDNDDIVHFYQFKNPESAEKGFKGNEVDRVISGLTLMLLNKHEECCAEVIKEKIAEIRQIVPAGYRLHLVTSGTGIPEKSESKVKLDAFAQDKFGSVDFSWHVEELKNLQENFYRKNLPVIDDDIFIPFELTPYQIGSGDHVCHIFHTSGDTLAHLYEKYGERLLERNIRIDQGSTPANDSIAKTCAGDDSANFFHYNNGVTFLCEKVDYVLLAPRKIKLVHAQIVNGGQTTRILHRAFTNEKLKSDVLVSVRVITSEGDKEFGNNVTVNLNNQNKVKSSFLVSNDSRVITLANAFLSLGYYLDRREEAESLSDFQKQDVEKRTGKLFSDLKVIPLEEGVQAYVSTYWRKPELAKKSSLRMFIRVAEGGYFEKIFNADMKAEKFITAYEVRTQVALVLSELSRARRSRAKVNMLDATYLKVFGTQIVRRHSSNLDQITRSGIEFICALLSHQYLISGRDIEEISDDLKSKQYSDFRECIKSLMIYVEKNPTNSQTWLPLYQSQNFFDKVAGSLPATPKNSNGTK